MVVYCGGCVWEGVLGMGVWWCICGWHGGMGDLVCCTCGCGVRGVLQLMIAIMHRCAYIITHLLSSSQPITTTQHDNPITIITHLSLITATTPSPLPPLLFPGMQQQQGPPLPTFSTYPAAPASATSLLSTMLPCTSQHLLSAQMGAWLLWLVLTIE